jgi:hypothetical protein
MPLTTEELIKTVESHQSTIMFDFQGDIRANIIRNTTGQLARFGQALNKFPLVYWDEYRNMDLYELLTKRHITYVTEERNAKLFVKTIESPKCTDLFMTVIDGIHIYVFCRPLCTSFDMLRTFFFTY